MELIFAGDLVLDEPDPDHWLSGIAPALQSRRPRHRSSRGAAHDLRAGNAR